jgi:tetratricopeptide (TPR) repeat protein
MNGLFLMQWTEDGYAIAGKFYQEGFSDLLDDLVLRIAISHEPAEEYSSIPTSNDTIIFSRSMEFKDADRKRQKIILGVEVPKSESTEQYKRFLVRLGKDIQEHVGKPKEELDGILGAFFTSFQTGDQAAPADVGGDLQTRIISRAKTMISQENVDDAQELLEKAKTIPGQLQKLVDKGSRLLKQEKIEEAEKIYKEAIQLAQDIQEDDLAKKLAEDFKNASDRPKIIMRIQDLEDRARKALKAEDYKKAAESYREAAKEVSKLNDVDTMNEFTKKAQLLSEFSSVDKAKKRSF